jgi:signal transduction histidine kinase
VGDSFQGILDPMNTAERGTRGLLALIIGAGALLALLAILLTVRSKGLLKDVVRQGCTREAQAVARRLQARLEGVTAPDAAAVTGALREVLATAEGDDRYGVGLQGPDAAALSFEPRVTVLLEPPLDAWRIAVGIEDPEAVRDALRLQTGLLVALSAWLLVVLVGGVLLLARRQRAEAARQARREQFLARAYHELQTPLALLRAAAESVERGALERPEHLERAVAIVKREEARLTATIRRLLRVLRLQGGGELEWVGAADEVREATEEQRESLAGQSLTVSLEVADGLEGLRVPRDLLGDVTRELLANACKHAREGSAVTVALSCQGKAARLTVSDDGPGFGQAPASTGSGLGLTLVEEALVACGGRLERGASQQGGARVTVELPCQA